MMHFRAIAVLAAGMLCLAAAALGAEFKEGTSGPASLRFVEGVPVTHVHGTPAAMGEQQGKLLGPQVRFLMENYLGKLLIPGVREPVLKLSHQMAKSIPKEYIEEMTALAKAAEIGYDEVLLMNTVFDLKRAIFCSTVVAVGERSADKQPIFGRNLDFPTLGVAQAFSCVVVYHPAKGHAVASVTFPGIIGVLSGLNDAGVAAAVMEVHLRGSQVAATPYAMVFRTALTDAKTTDEVLAAVKDRARTSPNNLMICDAAGTAACAELGIKSVAVRTPEDGVIYSTNHFRSKELGGLWFCWRIPRIQKALKNAAKVDAAVMKQILADVAVKDLTMHSIVYRPASCEFELAIGEPPAARNKFVLLKKSVLFPAGEPK